MAKTSKKEDVLEETGVAEEVKTESVTPVAEKTEEKAKEEVKEEKTLAAPAVEKKEEKKGGSVESLVIKDGKVSVFSKERAGKTIIAVTGQLISFDENGNAQVDPKDALYLQKVKGIEIRK